MKVAIIKYNAGNIRSVVNAMERIGVDAEVTGNPEKIQAADKVIFPGVGEAFTTMEYLRQHQLDKVIVNLHQPVLGICIGLQLMCKSSTEAPDGHVDCLGIFEETVQRFVPDCHNNKVPHMGWNTVSPNPDSPLFKGVPANAYFYYVHSFYASVGADTAAVTNYINPYSASLHKDNFYAVQFHPEKSGPVGEVILNNFFAL